MGRERCRLVRREGSSHGKGDENLLVGGLPPTMQSDEALSFQCIVRFALFGLLRKLIPALTLVYNFLCTYSSRWMSVGNHFFD